MEALLRNAGVLCITGHILQPVQDGLQWLCLPKVLASLQPHMFPIDELLKRLSVVNPLEGAKSIGNWHHIECLQVQIAVLARRVFLENQVHDLEELLHALVESQILTSLNQQVVIFLVTSVHCDALWPSDGAQDKHCLPD